MSFHFSLSAAQVLELVDLINAHEGEGLSSLAELRHALYRQLPPAFSASRSRGQVKRFAPYPPNRGGTPGSPGPDFSSGKCSRGGTKKIAPRQWEEVAEPFLEKEGRARDFLHQLAHRSGWNIHDQACLPWMQELKRTLIANVHQACSDVTDSLLRYAVQKCGVEGSKTLGQMFTQILAQMEFSKVIDK